MAKPCGACPEESLKSGFSSQRQRLNSLTAEDTYPQAQMEEYIDSSGDAKVFSTIDCNSESRRTEISEEDRHKTAFSSHHALFRLIRMSIGLKTAPAFF